jgi:hypothetical protein
MGRKDHMMGMGSRRSLGCHIRMLAGMQGYELTIPAGGPPNCRKRIGFTMAINTRKAMAQYTPETIAPPTRSATNSTTAMKSSAAEARRNLFRLSAYWSTMVEIESRRETLPSSAGWVPAAGASAVGRRGSLSRPPR